MADPASDPATAATEETAVHADPETAVDAEGETTTFPEQTIAPTTQPHDPPIEWPTDVPDEEDEVDDATLLRRYAENEKLLAVSRALRAEAMTLDASKAKGAGGGMNGARTHITDLQSQASLILSNGKATMCRG